MTPFYEAERRLREHVQNTSIGTNMTVRRDDLADLFLALASARRVGQDRLDEIYRMREENENLESRLEDAHTNHRIVSEELVATLKRCSDYQKRVEALEAELKALRELAPAAVPDCFWPLVYADSALAYIREHHPAVYAECGDDEKFAAERKAVIAAAQKEVE